MKMNVGVSVASPYGIRHFYATIRLQNGISRIALCENLGITEPYLSKHYAHYSTKLATDDLTRMNAGTGIEGRIISDAEDFSISDVAE